MRTNGKIVFRHVCLLNPLVFFCPTVFNRWKVCTNTKYIFSMDIPKRSKSRNAQIKKKNFCGTRNRPSFFSHCLNTFNFSRKLLLNLFYGSFSNILKVILTIFQSSICGIASRIFLVYGCQPRVMVSILEKN